MCSGKCFNLFTFEVIVDVLFFKLSGFAIDDEFVFSRFVILGRVNPSGFSIRDCNAVICAFINETSWGSLQAAIIELLVLFFCILGVVWIMIGPIHRYFLNLPDHLLCALYGRLHKPVVGHRRGFDYNVRDQVEAFVVTSLGEVYTVSFLPYPLLPVRRTQTGEKPHLHHRGLQLGCGDLVRRLGKHIFGG